MNNRIQYLDGLRGVAIILVVLFHAFARWPNLTPYGDEYAGFFITQYGWVGVELFFIISGFVIFMTLEKSSNIMVFMYKRWLRLFPAMLIASVFIYITAPFFYERPAGQPTWLSLIPGLTFINPSIFKLILKIEIKPLEGAFWSLYIEMFFYLIAACAYFVMGKFKTLLLLISLFLTASVAAYFTNSNGFLHKSIMYFPFVYFGWFAAGATLYLYTQNNQKNMLLLGAVLLVLSSISTSTLILAGLPALLLVSVFFLASLKLAFIQKLLSCKILVFVGYISYPLYLLHENLMIAMTIKLNNWGMLQYSELCLLISILFIVAISFIIVKWLEPMLRNTLTNNRLLKFKEIKHQN